MPLHDDLGVHRLNRFHLLPVIGELLHLCLPTLGRHILELDPDVIVITGFVRGMVLGDHRHNDRTLAKGPVGASGFRELLVSSRALEDLDLVQALELGGHLRYLGRREGGCQFGRERCQTICGSGCRRHLLKLVSCFV